MDAISSNLANSELDRRFRRVVLFDDKDEFDWIHNQLLAVVRQLFLRSGFSSHDAEELSQIVWMKVWSKRKSFKTSKDFLPWLYTIAYNVRIDRFRKMAGRVQESGMRFEEPVGGVEAKEFSDLYEAIALLAERRAEIVRFRLGGATIREIAQHLQCSPATVSDEYKAARNDLKRILKKWREN